MFNQYRPTWIEIHLNHLVDNFRYYQNILSNKAIIPVIKANAYGHGASEVFKELYKQGVRLFAVSLLEEAIALKQIHKDADVLMMGAILDDQLEIAYQHDIIVTVYDNCLYDAIKVFQKPLRLHIKVDTGMHRYGLSDDQNSINLIESLQKSSTHKVEGIYTHFATATDDMKYYHHQIERFRNFIEHLHIKPSIVHCSNSSSMDKEEKNLSFTTHARLGISLYGLSLEKQYPKVKPVLYLKSKIVMIKKLKKGDCLGYGLSYCADEDMLVGLLPIGYADGWIRKNKHGKVYIHDQTYPIIGNICMDTTFIKLDQHVKVHDIVTLIGENIKADEVAKRLQTIHYEVLTNLTERIPRLFIKDGE